MTCWDFKSVPFFERRILRLVAILLTQFSDYGFDWYSTSSNCSLINCWRNWYPAGVPKISLFTQVYSHMVCLLGWVFILGLLSVHVIVMKYNHLWSQKDFVMTILLSSVLWSRLSGVRKINLFNGILLMKWVHLSQRGILIAVLQD